ncbi:MAG: hypothetical protein QF886_16955, partial [Planctomycetota bacterium]|nr:hypothetical protein [Planctomycetota bacterium]
WPEPVPHPKLVLACIGATRRMEQVPFEMVDDKMKVTMPGFDTHAMLLALQDSDPLISLECEGAERKVAGLIEMTPNARLKIKATIWNPSPRRLKKGVIQLHAAPGWFCDRGQARLSSIRAWGKQEVSFEVQAPSLCAARTLKPIVFRYQAGDVTSTPGTELVWWTPEE